MTNGRIEMPGLERLGERLESASSEYQSAVPFPHAVIDDVIEPATFRRAVAEFPDLRDSWWTGYLHVNEAKYANPNVDTWGPTLESIARVLCADEFVQMLGALTGFENLIPDWSMDGGGLHQTLRGGHLNVHADFTTHHHVRSWRRRVNLLLYLNETWQSDWGGAIELWDSDMRRCVEKVAPLGNRMLIFTTSGDAYHGHPDPLACPDDVARRSLALYYFTAEDHPPRRSTRYRARPGDGPKGMAIWMDRQALNVYDRVKSRFRMSDRFASGALQQVHRLTRRRRF